MLRDVEVAHGICSDAAWSGKRGLHCNDMVVVAASSGLARHHGDAGRGVLRIKAEQHVSEIGMRVGDQQSSVWVQQRAADAAEEFRGTGEGGVRCNRWIGREQWQGPDQLMRRIVLPHGVCVAVRDEDGLCQPTHAALGVLG